MLIRNEEAASRINNPNNLINLLTQKKKNNNAMALFTGKREAASQPEKEKETVSEDKPLTDELITDADARIKLATAHDKALSVMSAAIDLAGAKLDDVRADKLPGVITAMSKVVTSIRQERLELNKINKGNDVHYHFYTPVQKTIEQYEVIEVS